MTMRRSSCLVIASPRFRRYRKGSPAPAATRRLKPHTLWCVVTYLCAKSLAKYYKLMKFPEKMRRRQSPETLLAAAILPPAPHKPSEDHRRLFPKSAYAIALIVCFALFTASGRGAVTTPEGVDTNPLNLDPL